MIDYGAGPATDEFEISLFGPGYGEAIAVHLGEKNWLLVDSCLDPFVKQPASAVYLDQIGVAPDRIKAIVASHWHDDHVKGISVLAAKYPAAEFMLSSVFNDKEAAQFLAAFTDNNAPSQASGTTELYNVIESHENVFPVQHRTIVLDVQLTGRQVRAMALSPLPMAVMQSIAHMAQYIPKKGGDSPIGHAPELKPNMEAVAIHIDLGGDAILLGSDLENHKTHGWTALVSNAWTTSQKKASAYKVAHHGSVTADIPGIWTSLLAADPVAVLTPFSRSRLPSDVDKARMRNFTKHRYISSGKTRKPDMDSKQLKRLSDICRNLVSINSGFGAIRLRKQFDAQEWRVECFGFAQAF